MRTSTGKFAKGNKPSNQPAECELCGRKFKQSNHMARHMRECPGMTMRTLANLLRRKGFINVNSRHFCWLPPETATGRYKIQGRRAHIVTYEIATGTKVLPTLVVCHKCDVGGCCNPRHLFLGTQKDNMWDMMSKGRGRGQIAKGTAGNANITKRVL